MKPMKPELRAYTIINCARYALVGFVVYWAARLNSGMFLATAATIAIFCGSSVSHSPDVCPKCGAIIKPDGDEEEKGKE